MKKTNIKLKVIPLCLAAYIGISRTRGYFYGFISGIQRYESTDKRGNLHRSCGAGSDRHVNVHQAFCGCLLILVENILPKKRSSLTPPTTNGETPPARTAIAPNYLTFYFLQIRTAGSFDKAPAIIL